MSANETGGGVRLTSDVTTCGVSRLISIRAIPCTKLDALRHIFSVACCSTPSSSMHTVALH